jgi:tetratricopeptide (TPR) repeat protein
MVFWTWCATALPAQFAAPAGEGFADRELLRSGTAALDREDPLLAWRTYREVLQKNPDVVDGFVGLGRTHLMLSHPCTSLAYARVALAASELRQDAMALSVRAQIRARKFEDAALAAAAFVARITAPESDLLAAQASALFRIQHTDEAAAAYRCVLQLDPDCPEAHLRLGSGLTAPCTVARDRLVEQAVALLRQGQLETGIQMLRETLGRNDSNPIAHRLLGEALFQRRMRNSMASQDPAFRRLSLLLTAGLTPERGLVVAFIPAYSELAGERRRVVDSALGLFMSRLPRLIALGARHDLMLETERTTDADSRASLRGTRTFDGRVWDDVRGIGGLQAATGIEALDEAAQFGFDTLVHEIAHQVHYYALSQRDRIKIRALYTAARQASRCIDYYAATNEAEYFGQGVEAFASLGKRPGGETTHGHTRFELQRVDPALHDFIAAIVDRDPLRNPELREGVLLAAIEVALRCGRAEDALVASRMLAAGPLQDECLLRTQVAVRDGTAW